MRGQRDHGSQVDAVAVDLVRLGVREGFDGHKGFQRQCADFHLCDQAQAQTETQMVLREVIFKAPNLRAEAQVEIGVPGQGKFPAPFQGKAIFLLVAIQLVHGLPFVKNGQVGPGTGFPDRPPLPVMQIPLREGQLGMADFLGKFQRDPGIDFQGN